ncbi:hypothetical protein VP01_715g1 [Puccinia sorghi]|uniref:Uncharacterized protein n=1 Tax=Puccinia sorghi TaxID=27349 RepID=A0A0L6UFK2_9BASI|nr:hypothetical protein VP01_715g1 [Puccinia sorghi]
MAWICFRSDASSAPCADRDNYCPPIPRPDKNMNSSGVPHTIVQWVASKLGSYHPTARMRACLSGHNIPSSIAMELASVSDTESRIRVRVPSRAGQGGLSAQSKGCSWVMMRKEISSPKHDNAQSTITWMSGESALNQSWPLPNDPSTWSTTISWQNRILQSPIIRRKPKSPITTPKHRITQMNNLPFPTHLKCMTILACVDEVKTKAFKMRQGQPNVVAVVPLGLRDTVRLTVRRVMAVKKILPLGSQEWCVCTPWIREAKDVDKAIQNRAAHNVLINDEGDKDGNTNDKRNGIGAPVPLSPHDENDPSQLNHSHHMDNSEALNQPGPNSSAGLAPHRNDRLDSGWSKSPTA